MSDYIIGFIWSCIFLCIFAAIAFDGFKSWTDAHTKIEIAYDCRLAEISPDYPQAVKTQCRKLMEK
jgi:hypothetical protein